MALYNLQEQINWWELYLNPLKFFPTDNSTWIISKPTKIAYWLPIIIFALVGWTINFALMSNVEYLEYLVRLEEERNVVRPEMIEMSRIGMEYIMENFGARVILGGTSVIKATGCFIVLLFILYAMVFIYTGQWVSFLNFWLISLSSTLPFVFGWIIFGVLSLLLLFVDTGISLALLLPFHDRYGQLYQTLLCYNLFVFWFFILLSTRLSVFYNERSLNMFILLLSTFSILVLVASFLNIKFFLIGI